MSEEEREKERRRRANLRKYFGFLQHTEDVEDDRDDPYYCHGDAENFRMLLCPSAGTIKGQDVTSAPINYSALDRKMIEQQRRYIEMRRKWR